jgi:hypothetical protein
MFGAFEYSVQDTAGNAVDIFAEVEFEVGNNEAPFFNGSATDLRARAGTLFEATFFADEYFDDNTDFLRLEATLANGEPLPEWLHSEFEFEAGELRLTGRPADADAGELSLAVIATDNQLATTQTNYPLTVYPEANLEPLVTPDVIFGFEDITVVIDPATQLLGNDRDPEQTALTLESVSNPVGGTVEINAQGSVVFTPAPDFNAEANGAASFDYVVVDAEGGRATGQAFVSLRARRDDVKVGEPLEIQRVVVGEELLYTLPDKSLFHPDGTPVRMSVTLVDGSAAPEWIQIAPNSRTLRVVPPAGAEGSIQVRLNAMPIVGPGDGSVLDIEVQPNNSLTPPVAAADDFAINEDDVLAVTAAELHENDTSGAADATTADLTLLSVENATNGRVSLSQGEVTFQPDENYFGPAGFSYTVQAPDGALAVGTASIDIASVDDALGPIAVQTVYSVSAGSFDVPLNRLFADADSDELAYQATLADGSALPKWLRYIPGNSEAVAGDLYGNIITADDLSLELSVTATNATGQSVSQLITLNVEAGEPNRPPAGSDVVFAAVTGVPLQLSVDALLANDIDPERKPIAFDRIVDVIDGSVEFTDGALTITEGELGSARFSYAVNDEAGAESIQWVDVNFFADDAAPGSTGSVGGQFLFGSQRTSFWFLPANTFSHANGDSLQVAATLEDGSPLPDWLEFIDVYNADAAQDANGTILPRNFFGTDARWVFSAIIPQGAEALDPASFNVRVTATDTDGDTASVTQTVTVFGNRGLRAELAADDRFYTQVNEPLVITDTDLFNNDVGGGVFSFGAFVSNEANGRAESVTDQLEERFRYVEFTPDQDFIGTASFDLDLFGYESTVFVEVLGPNRPPVVLVEDATVRAGQETVLPLRDDVTSDPDGDSVSLQFALSDGSALPSWLVFDTENMAFVANPPLFSAPGTDGVDGDQEVESLEITARDC